MRMDKLSHKLENIEINKNNVVASVTQTGEPCAICDTIGHATILCPSLPVVKDLLSNAEQGDVNSINNFPRNHPLSGGYQ